MLSVAGGIVLYFIRIESKLARIVTDLCWIKKVLDSRQETRKKE
jgi:hypothetical protein